MKAFNVPPLRFIFQVSNQILASSFSFITKEKLKSGLRFRLFGWNKSLAFFCSKHDQQICHSILELKLIYCFSPLDLTISLSLLLLSDIEKGVERSNPGNTMRQSYEIF